jgi:histidinol dehydrogenase
MAVACCRQFGIDGAKALAVGDSVEDRRAAEACGAEFAAAARQVAPADRQTIRAAHRQIADFARRQKRRDWSCRPRPGVTLGERFTPLDRVGVYVPGGTAPLVSTVLHTTTLAKVAGVREIVIVTPPRTAGAVHPAVLYAAQVAGATQVLKLGGVYAVGALAYGTESIRPVEKIVGPGNAYVTAAKRQVYGDVALDLVAGPSEILIIADDTANPRFIAADMLSQAEHGSGREQVYLITTHEPLVAAVQAELARQAAQLPRQACVQTVLDHGAFMIVVPDLAEAAAVASAIAPEHLDTIFEEYVQIGNPERDRTKGLGLGLAIAKRLATVLETDVVCRSKPGKGSVFEFRLPCAEHVLAEEQSRIKAAPPDTGATPGPARRNIVVVEDDVMVAKAIQLSLELQGMSVTRYANAEDALASPEITTADFYISDFGLPGLNGIEFLDALRQRLAKPVKAVLLTGDTSSAQITTTESLPWAVLFKPISLPRLLAAIESQDSTM